MDFADLIKQLGEKVTRLRTATTTEEGTKMAFIVPLIRALGYDDSDPTEVIPEYGANIALEGMRQGEKVDYCIAKENNPIMIIECKKCSEKLDFHKSQLHRYFGVTPCKVGILTNGVLYRFYADLEQDNIMDSTPFLEFDITNINEIIINELKKFQKHHFDIQQIKNSDKDLKFTKAIKEILKNEYNEPTDEFSKFFASKIWAQDKKITARILETFKPLVKKSFQEFFNEFMSERLKIALVKENEIITEQTKTTENPPDIKTESENKIVTTVEEMEAYYLIKSILRTKIESQRIAYRDALSYFSILIDDKNNKPVCRLYLDGKKKRIGLFDKDHKEIKNDINSIDEIYNFTDILISTALSYDLVKTETKQPAIAQ